MRSDSCICMTLFSIHVILLCIFCCFLCFCGWNIAPLYLIFMFVVYHGRKIAHALYIYPYTGTENNTERFLGVSASKCFNHARKKTSQTGYVHLRRRHTLIYCTNSNNTVTNRRHSHPRILPSSRLRVVIDEKWPTRSCVDEHLPTWRQRFTRMYRCWIRSSVRVLIHTIWMSLTNPLYNRCL